MASESDILLRLRLSTKEARKDVADFQKYVSKLQSAAASTNEGKTKVAQLPREATNKLGRVKTVDPRNEAALKKEVAQRAKLVALAQEEARLVAEATGQSVSSQKLGSIRSGALKSIAASLGLDEVPKAVEREFSKILRETKKRLKEELAQLEGVARQNKFRSAAKPILEEAGVSQPVRVRQASVIDRENERLNREAARRRPRTRRIPVDEEAAEAAARATEKPTKTRSRKAADEKITKSTEKQAASAESAAKTADASDKSQKASKARSDKALSRKADADEKAAKAAEATAQKRLKESYENDYGTARVDPNTGYVSNLVVNTEKRGQGYGRDIMSQIVADADAAGQKLILNARDELQGFYESFGFQKTDQEMFGQPLYEREVGAEAKKQLDAERSTTQAKEREARAAERQAEAEEIQAGVLFGEAPEPEKIRRGTIPTDELPVEKKKEEVRQLDFLAQELTIEDALSDQAKATNAVANAELELVKLKEQEQALQERINAKNAEKMQKLQESADAIRARKALTDSEDSFPVDSDGYLQTPPGYDDELVKLTNDRYDAEEAALRIARDEEKLQKERNVLLDKIRATEREILSAKLSESGASLENAKEERRRQKEASLRSPRENEYGTRFDRNKGFNDFKLDNPDEVRSVRVPDSVSRNRVERLEDVYPLDPSIAAINRGKLTGPDPSANFLEIVKGKEKEIRAYLQQIIDDAERQLDIIAQELALYDQNLPKKLQSPDQRELNNDQAFYEEQRQVAQALLEEEKKTAGQIKAENVKQVAAEKETTKALERRREVLKPDEVIPPPGKDLVPTGEKITGTQSGFNQPVIDARSVTAEEKREYVQNYAKAEARKAAEGTRGVDPIVVEGEERKALVAKTKEAEAAEQQAVIEAKNVATLQQIEALEANLAAELIAAKKREVEASKNIASKTERKARRVSSEALPDKVNAELPPNMKLALERIMKYGPEGVDRFALGPQGNLGTLQALQQRGLVNRTGPTKYAAIPTDEMESALDEYNEYQKRIKRIREKERRRVVEEEEAFVRSLYDDLGPEGEKLVQTAKSDRKADLEPRKQRLQQELEDAQRAFENKWINGIGGAFDEVGNAVVPTRGRVPILGERSGGEFDFLETLNQQDTRNITEALFTNNTTGPIAQPPPKEFIEDYLRDLRRIQEAEEALYSYRANQPSLTEYANDLYRQFPEEFTPPAPPEDLDAARLAQQTEAAALAVTEPTGDPKSAEAIANWQSVIESELRQTAEEYQEQLNLEQSATGDIKSQSVQDDKLTQLKAEYAALIERKIILERALIESRNKVRQIDKDLETKDLTFNAQAELLAIKDRELAQQKSMDAQLSKLDRTAIPEVQRDFLKQTDGSYDNMDDALDTLDAEIVTQVKRELSSRIGLGDNIKVRFDLVKEALLLDRKIVEAKKRELAAAEDARPRLDIGGEEYVVINQVPDAPPIPKTEKPIPVENVAPVETAPAKPTAKSVIEEKKADVPSDNLDSAEGKLVAALDKKTFLITSQAQAVEKRLPAFIEAENELIQALQRKAAALNSQIKSSLGSQSTTGDPFDNPSNAPQGSSSGGGSGGSGGGGGKSGNKGDDGDDGRFGATIEEATDSDEALQLAQQKIVKAFNELAVALRIQKEQLIGELAEYRGAAAAINKTITSLAAGIANFNIQDDPELFSDYTFGGAKAKAYGAVLDAGVLDQLASDPELSEQYIKSQLKLIGLNDKLAALLAEEIKNSPAAVRAKVQRIAKERELAAAIDREIIANGIGPEVEAVIARQQRNLERDLVAIEDPRQQEILRQREELNQRRKKIRTGQDQPVGLVGRITRAAGYDRAGGSSLREFFGGGALASLRYGLPSMLLYGAGSGITNTIKEAEELQYSLARLEGQFEATFAGQDFSGVRNGILSVAKDTGLAANEIANLQIQLTGAFGSGIEIQGVRGLDLVEDQVESAAKLAQTVGLPLAEITDGLTAASLAFNASFERIGDVALSLEQESGVLARETVSFIGDIAPVAQEAGYELEEFAAIAAVAQQRSGRSGAALAESFGRVIPALTENKQALLDLAAIEPSLGTPGFVEAIRTSDAKKILDEIGRSYTNMSKEGQQATVNLLGGRREAQAIIPAIANQTLVERYTKDAKESAGTLEERFSKIQETLTNGLQRLLEVVRQLGVEILEAGLADALQGAIDLAKLLATALGPVLTTFTSIDNLLGGFPTKLVAFAAAIKALQFAGTKQVQVSTTNALTGEVVTRTARERRFEPGTFAGYRPRIVDNYNFLRGQRSLPLRQPLPTPTSNPLAGIPSIIGTPLAPVVNADKELGKLRAAAVSAKTSGTNLLQALGGGSAAIGGGVVAVTALTSLYSWANSQIEKEKAKIDELFAEIQRANAEIDLEVPDLKARRVEDLKAEAESRSKESQGYWAEIAGDITEAEANLSQALALETTEGYEDAIKVLDQSRSLTNEIFDAKGIKLGKPTGGLRDQAASFKELIREDIGYTVEKIDGEYKLYKDGAESAYADIAGADAEFIDRLQRSIGDQELDFGFVEATLQKDSTTAILDLAKGDPEAVKKYGAKAVDNAQAYVETVFGLAADDPEFDKEVDALLNDLTKLPPLEDNQLKLDELKAGYETGLLTIEEYGRRTLDALEARRSLLLTQDETAASELEILQNLQKEQEAYAALAAAITDRQNFDAEVARIINGEGESDAVERSVADAKSNLANELFRDPEARKQAALTIIEGEQQIALNMALAANDQAEINRILAEGVAISPDASAVLAVEDLKDNEDYQDFVKQAQEVFGTLFDRDFDFDQFYEDIMADVFDDGVATPERQQGLQSQAQQLLGRMNAASFEELSAADQAEIISSFDQIVILMEFAGVGREKILAALRAKPGNKDLTEEELNAELDRLLAGSFLPDQETQAKLNRDAALGAIEDKYKPNLIEAEENAVAVAQYNKKIADEQLAYLVQNGGTPQEINAAKEKQVQAENALNRAYASQQAAKMDYYATMARINGDLIGAIDYDIQALQAQLAAAQAAQNYEEVWRLEGQIAQKRDEQRKQAVADANAAADLQRGLADLRGDLVEAALYALQVANNNAAAARTPEEKASAALAQAQAQAELIKAQFKERARDFDLFEAYLQNEGLIVESAQTSLAKAKEALAAARRGGNKDEINAAQIEVLNQEAALRQAQAQERDAVYRLFSKKIVGNDPIGQAKVELALAKEQLKYAKGTIERANAQIAVIDNEYALQQAMNDARYSMFELRQAELNAMDDQVGAAQVALELAKAQLNDAIASGAGTAAINNGRAAVIAADKNLRDTVINEKLDEYQWLLDMGRITQSQYINYLEGLKNTLLPGTKQFKDLELTIKQLKDGIQGDLQANLPTSLALPTLYEVRRFNQNPQTSTGYAGGVGYQDNRQVDIKVEINNATEDTADIVMKTMQDALGTGRNGYGQRRY